MYTLDSFKQIDIMFFAMLAGQVLVGLLLRFVLMVPERSMTDNFGWLAPIIVSVGIALALVFRRTGSVSAPKQGSISEKFHHYRKHLLLQLAALEIANIMALLLSILDNNPKTFYWFVLGVLFFLTLRPNKLKIQEDYNLSPSEMEQMM